MTMKFGKDILLVKIFTNWQKKFDDVIVMLILWPHQNVTAEKVEGFRWFRLNISKTVQQIFTKLMSLLGNHISTFLKLKYWRQVIHCCHGNQFMRECWAKNHDLREEKWHFLKISNCYCVFELRFEIRSLKLPLTASFSLIHPKTKKQWRLSTSLVVATSKWRLWGHTFKSEMISSKSF